jgi:ribonuclease H2 subunit B
MMIRICRFLTLSFTPLSEYLDALRQEEIAPLTSTNVKSKKNAKNVEEEEKKRKPKASQGVERLKKANIKGMAKLSTFFAKK